MGGLLRSGRGVQKRLSTNYTNWGRGVEGGAANVPVCEASEKLVFGFGGGKALRALADEDVCRSVFMADEDVCRSGTRGAGGVKCGFGR